MRSYLAYVLLAAAIACGDNNAAVDATPECHTAADCSGATECTMAVCNGGICGTFPLGSDTVLTQAAGDCQVRQCDGTGHVVLVEDDTDTPMGRACVEETCSGGAPMEADDPVGSACGSGLMCDGGGDCVDCELPNQCPGSDSECRVRSCQIGMCGFDNTPQNTVTKAQTAGDCQTQICDGSGGFTTITNGSDLPVDGNPCTDDLCTGSAPSNPDSAQGTACGSSARRATARAAARSAGCSRPLVAVLAQRHVRDQAHRQEERDQRAAAVADERQRHADDRARGRSPSRC